MKSYLSLIPISAKVRKRQNRMTLLCIIISVFLVTAVFSVAQMVTRAETDIMQNKHGNWHIQIKNLLPDTAKALMWLLSDGQILSTLTWKSPIILESGKPYFMGQMRYTFRSL